MEAVQCGLHKLIADVAVFAEGRVLLVRYADTNKYDHQPGWFLPDDVLALFEHPDAAAKRILAEQVSLSAAEPRLSYVESFRGRDRTWHLAFHYRVDVADLPRVTASADVATVEWFPPDALPNRSAVAHHGWALDVLDELCARASRAVRDERVSLG